MIRRPRVVFAMIEAGGGHKSTALAMSESLNTLSSGTVDVDVVDFSLFVGAAEFDAQHKESWKQMLKHGWITRIAYHLQDHFGTIVRWYIGRWALPFFEKAAEWFKENDPTIFIPTHWLNSAAAIYARKKYPHLQFKHFHFLTEPFDSTSVHHWIGADHFLVGSYTVAKQLEKKGIDPAIISVFDYPVRQSFFVLTRTAQEIKNTLGCIPGRLTLFMSGGAEGLGRFARFAQKIAKSRLSINFIVVCGKNMALQAKLTEEARAHEKTGIGPQIIALGYTNTMNELIAASDICAIKAGPASTFEALLWKRPVIFYEHIARHEKSNIEYVVSRGAGWFTPRFSQLNSLLRSLSSNSQALDSVLKNSAASGFKNGAAELSRFIYGAITDAK